MDRLLTSLAAREWRVSVPIEALNGTAALKEMIDEGVVPVLFVDTAGGTELDVMLDAEREADTTAVRPGCVRVVGSLVLNDVPVRAIVEIDLETMRGVGRLSVIGSPAAS